MVSVLILSDSHHPLGERACTLPGHEKKQQDYHICTEDSIPRNYVYAHTIECRVCIHDSTPRSNSYMTGCQYNNVDAVMSGNEFHLRGISVLGLEA